MSINLYNLNIKQTNVLKALAIIPIVLHNFLHWTNDLGENENSLDPNRIYHFFDIIANEPLMWFNAFFTYTGPFFLPLFIFLSGYGLTKKYMKNDTISYKNYIIPRLAKLYGLWIFGLIICYFLFSKYTPGNLGWYLQYAIKSLTLYNNLSIWRIYLSILGPWWYFAMAVQLYLLFPVLYIVIKKYNKKGFFLLLIINYLLIYVLTPIAKKYEVPIFGNFLGHTPEFILGIGFAMFKDFRISWKMVMPILCLFIASNFLENFFPFYYLSITIILLFIFYPIYRSKFENNFIFKSLVFIGGISMFMYLINGPLRAYYVFYFQERPTLEITLASLMHLLFVIIASYILSIVFKPINNLINNEVEKLIN